MIDPFEFSDRQSQTFFASGTFTVPAGVTSISAICIGGGSSGILSDTAATGGKGGSMAGASAIAVTPGEQLTITVGAGGSAVTTVDTFNAGSPSSISRGATVLLRAAGGLGGQGNNGTNLTTGSNTHTGEGGIGGAGFDQHAGGGGGAGGYGGSGGWGVDYNSVWAINPNQGVYGGAGGEDSTGLATAGGGIGIWGRGAPGDASGRGGSGANDSTTTPGFFGGGGGGNDAATGSSGAGGQGAVRIVWGNLSYGANGTGTATKTPEFIGAISGTGSLSNGATISVGTLPIKPGDLVIGVIGLGDTGTSQNPFSGFTTINSNTTGPRFGISRLIPDTAITSVTLNAAITADQSYIIAVFRNVHTSSTSTRNYYKGRSANKNNSNPTVTTDASAITESEIGVRNTLLLHVLAIDDLVQSTLTAPTGWTLARVQQRNNSTLFDGTVSLAYRIATSTTAISATGDLQYNPSVANWRGRLVICPPGEYTTT